MFRTIVVGTDGSESAQRALECAIDVARLHRGVLHVVTAYGPLSPRDVYERQRGLPPDRRREIDEASGARAVFDDAAKQAAAEGVQAELHARVGDAGAAVVQVVDDVGADLVVVGNRGMTGVRRVLGSVPNHVAHAARCSVLIADTH
jgi:nucleotide-binding universal stress UspA family protein